MESSGSLRLELLNMRFVAYTSGPQLVKKFSRRRPSVDKDFRSFVKFWSSRWKVRAYYAHNDLVCALYYRLLVRNRQKKFRTGGHRLSRKSSFLWSSEAVDGKFASNSKGLEGPQRSLGEHFTLED